MNETLPGLLDSSGELIPLNIIRTETALSRFPIHRLVKKGDLKIEIRNQSSALLWEVTYNSKYGQPGPLAYKLDTLVVNKRIEEAGHPTPRLLRLGSLRDICRELGNSEGGDNTAAIRNALLQNASAFINAKITYKGIDRTERFLEASFTRYSVLFTGETLPDGSAADAVYLLLNDPYWQVIDAALTRPLDYDYMRSLPPAAQRFYEIVSYQVYGALFHQNERARLRYSEYCLLSTATRYLTFDQVKKQMYKIHRPHLLSGYLAKIAYEQTTDDLGQPDWWMYYVPGPNAAREYRQFTGSVRKTRTRGSAAAGAASGATAKSPRYAPAPAENASLFLPFPDGGLDAARKAVAPVLAPQRLPGAPPPTTAPSPPATSVPPVDPELAALIAQLLAADLNREVAERFAREQPEECRRQLAFLPFVPAFKASRGAYLRRAIEQGFAPPKAYVQLQEEADARQKKQAQAEQKRATEAARRAAEAAETAKAAETLDRLETEAPEAFKAFNAYLVEHRRAAETQLAGMSPSIRAKVLKHWDTPGKRQEVFQQWQQLPAARQHPGGVDDSAPDREPARHPAPVGANATINTPEDGAAIRSLIEQALQEAPTRKPDTP